MGAVQCPDHRRGDDVSLDLELDATGHGGRPPRVSREDAVRGAGSDPADSSAPVSDTQLTLPTNYSV